MSEVAIESNGPSVCVCVPAFNAGKTIRESLASILEQSFPKVLIKVLDNCSTDDTITSVRALGDKGISIITSPVNRGAEENFTRCIDVACGNYTGIFHADDIYEPQMLQKQVRYLEDHPDVGAVFTEALLIDARGTVIGATGKVPEVLTKGPKKLYFPQVLRLMMLHHNFLVCSSALVRTHIYKDVIKVWGGELFGSASDIDTWLRVAHHAPIGILDEPLMRYRISEEQFSNKNRNRTDRMEFFSVVDQYLTIPEVQAFISDRDKRNYAWLERHDRVARAMNLFIQGRGAESRALLEGTLTLDALQAALATRRGFVTLAAIILLRALLPFSSAYTAMRIVRAAKHARWR